MSDLEKILEIIGGKNYKEDISFYKFYGIAITFDKDGNVKSWGYVE